MRSSFVQTGGVTVQDWREATKDMKISAYFPGQKIRTDEGSRTRVDSPDLATVDISAHVERR